MRFGRKRRRWLSGYTADTALDWDPRVTRWRVEIRYEDQRVLWSWPATAEGAAEQRREAERWKRPDARY